MNCLTEVSDSFVQILLFLQKGAQIITGIPKVRLKFKSFSKETFGLFGLPFQAQHSAEIVVCYGMVCINLNSFLFNIFLQICSACCRSPD